MTVQQCGAVILAGGHSRRMGRCKALLAVEGETMLSRLSRRLSAFDERLLSANDIRLAEECPLEFVPDIYPDCGPMGGLHAALSHTKKDALLCVPCDMPNFIPALADLLLTRFSGRADVLVCRDSAQRVHPLCGIYTKGALCTLESHLTFGRLSMMDLLSSLHCEVIDTAAFLPDSAFWNMNTPDAYAAIC